MDLTPALEDRMCGKLDDVMAKSQPLAAQEGAEELV
jgi:hypothetical protein